MEVKNAIQVTTPGTRPAGANSAGSAAGVLGASLDKSRAGAAGAAAAGREDEVQLSSLGSAIESLQPGSEAREAQVSALREAVASGRYQVDAGAVAGRIVEDVRKD